MDKQGQDLTPISLADHSKEGGHSESLLDKFLGIFISDAQAQGVEAERDERDEREEREEWKRLENAPVNERASALIKRIQSIEPNFWYQRITGEDDFNERDIDTLEAELVRASRSAGLTASSLTPSGGGRDAAFNEAKRQSGVPTSSSPVRVRPNYDRRGKLQPGRVYDFDILTAQGIRTVSIREDSEGHYYGLGNFQNRGPHFNDENDGHYDYGNNPPNRK